MLYFQAHFDEHFEEKEKLPDLNLLVITVDDVSQQMMGFLPDEAYAPH